MKTWPVYYCCNKGNNIINFMVRSIFEIAHAFGKLHTENIKNIIKVFLGVLFL